MTAPLDLTKWRVWAFRAVYTQANAAEQAARIALRMGDQAEAQRQFNLSHELRARAQGFSEEEATRQFGLRERAQGFSERMSEGQFGEAQRQFDLAQRLRERAQGFSEEQAGAEFQFRVQQDPSAPFQQAFAGRNLATPGGGRAIPSARDVGRLSGVPSGRFDTTGEPLSTREAFTDNPLVSPRLRELYKEGETRIPSQGSLYGLLPSERTQLGAGLRMMGYDPADIEEQSRRVSQTTVPALAARTVPRRRVPSAY